MLDVFRAKAKAIKQMSKDKLNDMNDNVSFQVRSRFLDQWCDYCGVTNPKDIDYNEPHVAIEYLLCDPVNIKLIRSKNPDDKMKVYCQFTEEMMNIYLYEEQNGVRYVDLETKSMVSLARGKKGKKKDKTK